ncbi:ECF transporter S component [Agathobacter sp.]
MRNEKVQKLTLTALMAALSYVIFTFLQIKITLPGGGATSFHLGNAVCVLAALLLGGVYGGIGGAIGMTIGDLLDPIYITGAPKTFFLKFMIGLITGIVAHKFGKITCSKDKKHVLKWTILAAVAGMLFNFIFDPIVSYFYDMLILGKPMAQLKIVWSVTTTGVNAVISVIAATIVYMALRPVLIKANLFFKIGKE